MELDAALKLVAGSQESVEVRLGAWENASLVDADKAAVLLNSLTPRGALRLVVDNDSSGARAPEMLRGKLVDQLVLAGFVGVEVAEHGDGVAVLAKRPEFNAAAVVPLQWGDDDDGEDELVDEEDIIPSEVLKEAGGELKALGCGDDASKATGAGRKACKDCSCGLAEQLASTESTAAQPAVPAKSSCGNCYLGDGFRCAGCPYLGMPPFQPGESIKIPADLMTSDL
ncbi:Anamorsin-like [Porphyridium purpureum]|uniref:Anamorsin homolog n=1 Tax=Porphyridium purpureum TaxID=35688 RepID=A0A5J4YYJ6_PORPP|nr:Anamorsin-like [Porphyridium purpureum]|eukprot:POR6052..scf209_3